jgi:predicted nucleic acid-binding protein
MQVVIDANVVISVLIAKGSKQDLLFSGEIEAISPEWLIFEVGKNRK